MEKAAGFLIWRHRGSAIEYLFLKRREGFLDLPKGHPKRSETELETALRESREETGLKLSGLEDRFFSYTQKYRNGRNTKQVRIFLAHVHNVKVSISSEHSGYVWLDYTSSASSLFPDQRRLLEQADLYISNKESLDRINREYSALPLKARPWGLSRKLVPGEGPPNAAIVLVGQAPGMHEDIEGRPFVGAAGKLLDLLLAHAKLNRNQLYITSAVQFFPPKNRRPSTREITLCKPFLDKQLAVIRPRLTVLMGAVAAQAFIGRSDVMKFHGKLFDRPSRRYFVTIHPAAAVRIKHNLPLIEQDFASLGRIVHSIRESF